MTLYMPDTNVWVGVGKDVDLTGKCNKALANGDVFLIAPPALIEVIRGMVRYGKENFLEDQKTFSWMQKSKCTILELTKPFMARTLRTRVSVSGVTPEHYWQLIEMVVTAASLDEFIKNSNAENSVWKNIENLDQIHEREIEKELRSLEQLNTTS